MTSPLLLFRVQKNKAKARGIDFLLTFEEWQAWWEQQLGPDWQKLRGKGIGKFVMARKGDKGPYSLKNIICAKHEQNASEGRKTEIQSFKETKKNNYGERNGMAKLKRNIVLKIFKDERIYRLIAKDHNTSIQNVSDIKRGKRWNEITKHLGEEL